MSQQKVTLKTVSDDIQTLTRVVDVNQRNITKLNEQIDKNHQDLLEVLHIFAEDVDRRFNAHDKRFDQIEEHTGRIEASMVTKSYLDDKLADLKGDTVGLLK